MTNELQEAYREGYDVGWEFHMGSGKDQENPYDFEDPRFDRWLTGYVDAGLDS